MDDLMASDGLADLVCEKVEHLFVGICSDGGPDVAQEAAARDGEFHFG